MQTDTTINPGNSRGPLINSMGEVIGVTTFMLSNKEGSGSIGINFALTISAVKDFMDDRLNPPENSLQKEGEERSKRFKEHRKYLASVFDKKYWEEYRIFLARVYYLNRGGVITGDQTRSLMDRPLKPPAGFNSIESWLDSLAGEVIKGDITEGDAITVIKNHFDFKNKL